jgi:hypothetical protein
MKFDLCFIQRNDCTRPGRTKMKFSQQLVVWTSSTTFSRDPLSNFGYETCRRTNNLRIMLSFLCSVQMACTSSAGVSWTVLVRNVPQPGISEQLND